MQNVAERNSKPYFEETVVDLQGRVKRLMGDFHEREASVRLEFGLVEICTTLTRLEQGWHNR